MNPNEQHREPVQARCHVRKHAAGSRIPVMVADIDGNVEALTAVSSDRLVERRRAGMSVSMSGRSPPGRRPIPGRYRAGVT